jgi:DNA-binding CsgD family transcriptional regulator
MSARSPDLPAGLYARVLHGQSTIVVLSFDSSRCSALTLSELDVARRAAAGESNEDIARARRTSVRTVANQITSVLRKLGLGSRSQLVTVPEVLA